MAIIERAVEIAQSLDKGDENFAGDGRSRTFARAIGRPAARACRPGAAPH